jgi:fatty acid desaturase
VDKSVEKEMLADFAVFRKSLEERGFFTPSYSHIVYRIIELVGLFGLSLYMIQQNVIVAIFLMGLFGGRCGWLQHEGGHNSLTGNIKIDKIIQNVFIGYGLLTDGSMWNHMHNRHHATPQKIGHDMDLDTAPLVAFFDRALLKTKMSSFVTFFVKQWLRFQMYTFLPITSGVFVMLFWILYLHPRKIIRDKNIVQACIVLFGHISRVYAFMALGKVNIWYGLFYHFLSFWVSGVFLFGHFSLSHTFTPVIEKDENPSWVRYAVEHTVDIDTQNPLVSWIMGYLNCQVVHHLFPSMPQYRQPQVSKELELFCKKWNIEYKNIRYFEAWYLMCKNLDDVGKNILFTEKKE